MISLKVKIQAFANCSPLLQSLLFITELEEKPTHFIIYHDFPWNLLQIFLS